MRTFLFVTLLFLFSRLFFLFSFDLSRGFNFGDDRHQGWITYEWIKGPNLPLMDYRGSTYMAGSERVMALWQIPFFLLLGPSLFTLRLASVAWSFLIFLLIYFFVRRHFSGRQAVWASLFFIFAPPSLIIMSLSALGYHFQSTLFVLAFFFVFYEHHFGSLKRNWALFLEGLVLGVGIYFSLLTLIVLLAFFIFTWILERRLFFHPSLLFFFLGLGLGYAPGLYDNFNSSFGMFSVYHQPLYEHFLGTGFWEKFVLTVKRLIWLLVRFISRSLRFEKNGFLAPWLARSWYLLVVFSFWMLFRNGTRRSRFLLVYAALFALVLAGSDFNITIDRYFSPLLVFFCILLGLYWGAPNQTGFFRHWGWLKVVGLVVCFIGWIPYLTSPQTVQFQKRGFSYSGLLTGLEWTGRVFGISFKKENLGSLIETGHRSLDRRFLPVFERTIGAILCFGSRESDLARDSVLIDEAEENIGHRANFYRAWGYCVACGKKEIPEIKTFLERVEKLPLGPRKALTEGAGEYVFEVNPSLKFEPPVGVYDDFYRGAGVAFGTLFEDAFEKGVEHILQFPKALYPILFEGFGKGTYWWDGGGGEITSTLKDKVPPPYRGYFQKGLAAAAYGGAQQP